MKKKIIFSVIAFSIIGILGITGVIVFRHMNNTSSTVARKVGSPLPVRLVSAETRPLTEVVGARGEIQFMSIVTVTSKLDRRVKEVSAEVGDTVKKGNVLVKFDNTLLSAALSTVKEEIKKTETELNNANLSHDRMNRLYAKGVVARVEVEEAVGKLKNAELLHMKARENLLNIESELKDSTVVSPVNGVVLERVVNSGETPQINQPMFRIGTSDSIFIVAYVDERRLQAIGVGQEAEVVFDAYHNKIYSGSVAKIGPQIDNKTATFPVFIKLKGVDIQLKPGLTSAVRVKNVYSALTVPSISTINPVGDSAFLFVVDEKNKAHLRPVKIGAMAEGMTEIVNGLAEGERVVSVGQLYLHDQDIVRIGDELNKTEEKYVQKRNLD